MILNIRSHCAIKIYFWSKSGHSVSISIYFGSPGHQIPQLYLICIIIYTTAETGHTATPGYKSEHQVTWEDQVTQCDPGHTVKLFDLIFAIFIK